VCGIAGILSLNKELVQQARLQKMADALAHRGPNGEGFYINPDNHLGFAHRRLSIVDLSLLGAQPMHYLNRYTIIHNGELYNYKEVKETLIKKGYIFTTQTDTEVIIAAYDAYKEDCLQYFDGMFAFALWDAKEQVLFIARDRFGEKPFYYYINEEQFCFASEMKALWAVGVPKESNPSLIALYLGLGYTSIPLQPEITFYQNIFSLPPAHYLKANFNTSKEIVVAIHTYWDVDKETKLVINEQEAIEQFSELFSTSVKRRLRSDVPIGTSLSGGLDSSSIVAFLKQLGAQDYSTFSAIFSGYDKDESAYIDMVKNQFHLQNFSVSPTANGFEKELEQLIYTQEQPFISSSVYAQYKVFELAKVHNTTVLIDGQGADETIGGYTKYLHWYLQELFLYDKKKYQEEWTAIKQNNPTFNFGFFNKMATWFPAAATNQLEKKAVNQLKWHNHLNPDYIAAHFSRLFIHKPLVKKLNDLLYYNTMQFGLEELLRYADKNAMAHGVEVRLPYLNHELVQFVFSLPSTYKIHKGFQKSILRKTVDGQLPNAITWRKDKVGYETPQQQWLQQNSCIEKINSAKEKLITLGVLNKNSTFAKSNTEQHWRWLIAAAYI
jgi:asparagine synthase (glutamine-hydrolysing)